MFHCHFCAFFVNILASKLFNSVNVSEIVSKERKYDKLCCELKFKQ